MKHKMYYCFLPVMILCLSACQKEQDFVPGEPAGERVHGLALVETGDGDVPYMLNHVDGVEIAVLDPYQDESYRSMIVSEGYEDPVMLKFDDAYRLTEIITENKIFVFDNYVNGRVDIAEINDQSEIRVWRAVEMNGLTEEEEPVIAPRGLNALIRTLKETGYIYSVASCLGSLGTVVGAIIPGSSALIQTLDRLDVEDRIPLLESAIEYFTIVDYLDGAITCATIQDLDNCIGFGLSVAERAAELLNNYLEENELNVDLARGALSSGDGDIKITLQWNTPVDLDLYVTDPSGETISYHNTSSASGGTLDVDDTNGFGPENIFYPNGQSGTYSVLVHYYEGFQTTSFVVRVQQAGFVKTYSGNLYSEDDQVSVVDFVYGQPLPLQPSNSPVDLELGSVTKTLLSE